MLRQTWVSSYRAFGLFFGYGSLGKKNKGGGIQSLTRGAYLLSLKLFKILSITGVTSVVNDQTFEQDVLKSDVPVLVDFWAPWCGPCRMIAPLIDQLAEEYAGKLKAVKLNTDESPSIATEYGIRSIPTVMIFKDGKKMDTVIGAVPKSTLTGTIEKYL